MKFIIIAVALGFASGYAQASEVENLKADIEAAKQRLSAAETETVTLQTDLNSKQTHAANLQAKLDQQAQLLAMNKASLDNAESQQQSAPADTAFNIDDAPASEETTVAVLDDDIISDPSPAPAADTSTTDDLELEFEIELTE